MTAAEIAHPQLRALTRMIDAMIDQIETARSDPAQNVAFTLALQGAHRVGLVDFNALPARPKRLVEDLFLVIGAVMRAAPKSEQVAAAKAVFLTARLVARIYEEEAYQLGARST